MSRIMLLAGPIVVATLSIPLALAAIFTTFLALNVLFLRYIMVCIDFAGAFARALLFETTLPTPKSPNRHKPPPPPASVQRNVLPREPSSMPVSAVLPPARAPSFGSLAMTGHASSNRDFEGIGGWRLATDGDDDDIWMGINSRLELPAIGGDGKRRHHKRTLSSQSAKFGKSTDAVRTPLARTPPVIDTSFPSDGYFGLKPHETIPMSPEESMAKSRMDERTRIMRSGSMSSGGSGRPGSVLAPFDPP